MAQHDNRICTEFLRPPGGKCYNASMPYRSSRSLQMADYVYTVPVDSRNRLDLPTRCLRMFAASSASSVAALSRARSLPSRNRPGENNFLGTSGESHLSIGDGVILVDRRLVIDQGIPSHTKCGSGRKLSVEGPLFPCAHALLV